jgi:2-polyprenyl-3-methyl-5-hydroxy-6-metoxy-1,4-benzoquinol methylase
LVCSNGRVLRPERMDSSDPATTARCLSDLKRVNSLLGGYRVLAGAMRSLTARDERFSVLDVGAASGDMGAMLRKRYRNAVVTSLDRRELHLQAGTGRRVAGDAFDLPFRPRSFDFVLSSLFLHHFENSQITDLLARMKTVARRAVLAVDLERHPIAYYFLPATQHLLGWHDVTVNDGRISVEAGFRAEELERIARAAGAADPKVRRHRPWFRLSLVMAA